mmetsp:Transcript_68152/g.154183  ORF Transcript_68152/g.154183 Transcript_68152/m.154183 type:complete len:151 (-) Transcript_68152:242-694(-)
MGSLQTRDISLLATGLLCGLLLSPLFQSRMQQAPIRAPGVKEWRMSKWIKHGGVIRTQGIVGDLTKAATSSVTQQTAEALGKLDDILAAAGVARANLLSVTVFLTDISKFDEMNEVYDKWVDPAGLPTRLCVQAKIGHGAALEIRAEAYY